jgi:autotransporter adhesin
LKVNRIYKTVWNEQTRTFVAVSELTRARGKRSGASVACGGGAGWLGTRLALGVAALVGAGMMSVSLPAFAEIVLQDSTSPIEVDGNGIVFSNGAGSIQFTNGGTITGLSNGSVAAGSTQAVNGGQLYTVQQNLTSAVTAAQSTAGQALTQANKGWNIKAGSEGGSGGNVQPGDTVTVAGGQNIDVTRSGTTLTVKTKDDINAATLASTGNTTVGGALNVNGATVLHNGVTVTGASQFNGPVTVSGQTTLNGGLNVAGNKITNVGDGTIAAGSTDAVTGGQLHDLQENLYESGTGIKYFHANSTQADSVAAGQDAIAIGPQSVANADASMAAGQGAVVGENADGAIAQGQGATVAQNAEAAIAIGQGAQVGTAGVAALAMGRDAQSNGAGSVAIGDGATVESEFVNNATALGTGASVTGAYSNNAMALGTDAVASAVGAAALGQSAAASGANALAGGTGASAEGASSVALGNNSRAGAGGTVSLGNGATTATQNSIAIGTNAGVGTVDVPVNPGFDKTSHIAIGTEAGQNVSGNQTTAIGYGAGSNITGDYTVSVGNEAGANLKGDHNISIGYLANQRAAATSVEHSVAIGGMSAAGTGSVAVGESAQANSEYAMALGFNARATSDGGVALGSGANAAGDSVALGSSSQAVASTGVGYLTGTNASQNPISVVSVGGGGGGTAATRRITNVADGAAATDAVNVSQLAASQQNLATILGQGTIVDGKVTEFKVGTQTYSSVAQALTELGNGGTGTVINDVGAVLYDGGSNSTVATLAGAGGTTVKNVKAGVDDTDAVNVAQLNKTVDDNKAHYYSVNSELSANYNNSGATGSESMAIGPSATASGANSVAVGHTAVVTGSNGTALGSSVQSLANNATVIGHGSIAYDESTVAIGEQAKSRGENSIVIGTRAEADAKEGSATVNNAIVIGTDADVTADNGVAIGEQSVSSATKAMAFGYEAAARGTSSTAIGANATSSGVNAIATGTGATSSGSNAQASGTGAVSSGADSIATGTGAVAYASNGIALGKGAVSGVATPDPDKVADNTDTIAIGTRASATAKNSVAIGVDSNTQSSYASTTARYSNVVHDDAASGVVSVGNHGGQGGANSIERRITNVAGGMYDTDAVNVKQLRAVRDTGWSYSGNSGSTTQTMGSDVKIVGGATTAVTSSQNVKTVVTPGTSTVDANGDVVYQNGKIEIQFAETPSFQGADMGGKKITSVAAGDVTNTSTDAVNGSQLKQVKDTAEKGWNLTANGVGSSNVAPGGAVDLANDDGNIAITKSGNNVKFNLADDVNVNNNLTVGGNSSVAGNMSVTGNTNLNGDVAVGGNTTMAGDLAVTGASTLTGGATIGNQLVVNPNTLVNMGGNKVTNVAAGEVSSTSTDAINGSQLHDVANRPITFQGNAGSTPRKLGETQVIRGSLDNGAAASSSNIRTTVNGAGEMEILLANNLTADSLTINNGGPVINAGGINMGGKKITNLAEGTDGTDAVNVDQLNRVDETANKGWNLTASGANASNVKPGDTVDLASAADNNIVVSKDASNNVKFGLADDVNVKNDLTVGGDSSVAGNMSVAGDTALAGDVAVGGNTTMAGDLAVTGASTLTGGATIGNQLVVNPNTLVNMGGNKVTNVAAGEVSSTSTDAINGSQLHDVANRPITFQGNTGDVARKLGETQIIRGSLAASDAASSSNIRTQVNAAGDMEILLANNLTADSLTINNGGPVLNAGGINMGGKKITNLAEGTDGTDAVNLNQLNKVDETANKGWNLTASGANASNVKPGDTVDLASAADNNIVVSKDASNSVKFGLADDVNVKNDLTVGGNSSVTGNMAIGGNTTMAGDLAVTGTSNLTGGAIISNQLIVNPNTLVNMGGNKVTNVAAGEVSSTSTDAINGSQLYDVANSPITFQGNAGSTPRKLGETQVIRGSLDNGAAASSSNIRTTVKAAGEMEILLANNLTADSLTINNGGPVINVSGIDMKSLQISNLAEGTKGTDAVNLDQLNRVSEVANKGWNLTANGADSSNVAPGATVDLANDDGNIDITKSGNEVKFNLAKDIAVDSVTTGNTVMNTDGITIQGGPAGNIVLNNTGLTAGTVEISSLTGINAGGFRITNVAAGINDTDAVNVSQLKDVQNNVDNLSDRAVKYDGNVGDPKNKVTLEGDVSTDGGRTGGTTVTNVARGEISADSTDAVNGSQIHDMGNSIADGMGGNSTFVDGKLVTELNVGGNTYNNVNDALNGVQTDIDNVSNVANKGWNIQTNGDTASKVGPGDTVQFINGDNIEITRDGTNVTVGMAKDIKVDSVTAGKVSTKEVVIENGPTINEQGVDMNGKQITNLADGKNASDAVNLGQLNKVAGNVANSINRLDSKVNRNDNRASAGVAAAMATAGLPQAYLPGKSMFSLAGGTWRGESGYAMGLSTVSDNGKWVIKGTASGSSRGDYGGSVGVGYQW